MPRRGVRHGLAAGCASLLVAAAPALAELPPRVGSPPSNADRKALSHLLASGMAAAWNARAAADTSQAPTVVIGDDWGNGKPPNLFSGRDYIDAKIVGGKIDNPPNGSGSDHGYHVTGIVFGSFANDGTPAGLVSGAFPRRGKLVPIDRYEDASLVNDTAKFAPAIDAISGRVIVNTSIGYRECVSTIAAEEAVEWIEKVRDLGLEDRVFHATAAGNEGAVGGSAFCASDYSAAATRNDLQDTQGMHVDPLTNTLSVENVEEASGSSALGCLTPTSNTDGSIAAPGKDVWSFTRSGGATNKDGTSMSTPLVAGLAAYLWSIAPDLIPEQLSAAIRLNADAPDTCQRTSARRLDAYAATLSLDQTGVPSAASWPVRFAILDKNGDGKFDHKDLAALGPKVRPSLLPTKRDWSRFDLNGDGFTGGADTAPFDLDRAGSTRAGDTVLDDPVTDGNGAEYDEGSVTDADVLCFYAYSPLYTGSPTRRTQELKKVCEPADSPVEFDPGTAQVLAVCQPSGQQQEEDVKFTNEFGTVDLTFSDTAATSCAGANQSSAIVPDSSGAKISGTGAVSASDEGGFPHSVLNAYFTVKRTVPWSITGTLASQASAPEVFVHSATAKVRFEGSGETLLKAGNCSVGAASSDCETGAPDSAFSDSGTLDPGDYEIALEANGQHGASASWDFTLDIG